MSGRISIWAGQIFLGCFFTNISKSVLLSHRVIIKNCNKPVLVKKKITSTVFVAICWLEFCTSLSFTAVNASQKWALCLFLFLNKKKILEFFCECFCLFYYKCYIHLVKNRNHFHFIYTTNKYSGIQHWFCKARLNVHYLCKW